MTTVAVLANPPRDGLVLPGVVAETPLSATEATTLYTAALSDVLVAVGSSGGDLLVNYRPESSIPDEASRTEGNNAENEVREVAHNALSAPENVRFEVQVGSTTAGRMGNTITHLLEAEEARSVAVVPGSAPFLNRTDIDGASAKLRTSEVVLGPAVGGGVYYAGFSDPIDFEAADAPPAVETLTDRALAADLGVDFLSMAPTIGTPAGLANAIALCRARERAGRNVPTHFAACIDELGLRAIGNDEGLAVGRRS